MRILKVLLLVTLGISGQWPALAVVALPATNRVALTWSSLGSGTRYYVQTSTNLLAWTTATNTTATNANLSFIGDKSRTFRLWASNAVPQSATFAWNPSAQSAGVAGYFLYYGAATDSFTKQVDVGLATNAVVTNLLAGTTYFFAVTSYTSAGLESDLSNEVLWQCPLRLRIQRLP